MNLSYWERKTWFSNVDFCIIGSGIVGLSCALQLKKMHPKAKVLVLERGVLPQGASTKNAGFACFGSMSEILSDFKNQTQEEVYNLVKMRYDGLALLRKTIPDHQLEYKNYGGYEVFYKNNPSLFERCMSEIKNINNLLFPIFNKEVFTVQQKDFQFQNILHQQIFNQFEAQIDTGKMIHHLLQKVYGAGIMVLNSTTVLEFNEQINSVKVQLSEAEITVDQLYIATNGFAKQFFNLDLQPARNQVLITEPIQNLKIKGVYHLDEGYVYFRNVKNRILLGGGRNLDKINETTDQLETTTFIQNALETILYQTILPNSKVKIDYRWSGILGVGSQKTPILKAIRNRVFCAVRLGGMGVAIGSDIGKKLALFSIR